MVKVARGCAQDSTLTSVDPTIPPVPSLARLRESLADRTVAPYPGSDMRAAIAAIFREHNSQLQVLLIKRADRTGDPWSGHMAFPGGRFEKSDAHLLDTAIRETREEIGLDLAATATLVARLDDIAAIRSSSGLVITPFVFALYGDDPILTPNEEVAEVLWTDVAPLMRGDRATTLAYRFAKTDLDLPAYDVGGRIVWGLTYQVLEPLLMRVNALILLDSGL